MNEYTEVAPIRTLKTNIAKAYCASGWNKAGRSTSINYHGVAIELFSESDIHRDQLVEPLPKSWHQSSSPDVSLTLVDSDSINLEGIAWDDDADPELSVDTENANEIAVQRDFLGVLGNTDNALLVTDSSNIDGIHNGLRWLLPRFLAKNDSILLHSAAIIGDDGRAYVFAGRSGVGKSTMASKSGGRTVLGDDAIVLTLNGDTPCAEAGALGQKPEFQGPLGQKYEIGALFFLSQGPAHTVDELSPAKACKSLIGSINFPGWAVDGETDYSTKIIEVASKYVSQITCYGLQLPISTTFEDVINGIK